MEYCHWYSPRRNQVSIKILWRTQRFVRLYQSVQDRSDCCVNLYVQIPFLGTLEPVCLRKKVSECSLEAPNWPRTVELANCSTWHILILSPNLDESWSTDTYPSKHLKSAYFEDVLIMKTIDVLHFSKKKVHNAAYGTKKYLWTKINRCLNCSFWSNVPFYNHCFVSSIFKVSNVLKIFGN